MSNSSISCRCWAECSEPWKRCPWWVKMPLVRRILSLFSKCPRCELKSLKAGTGSQFTSINYANSFWTKRTASLMMTWRGSCVCTARTCSTNSMMIRSALLVAKLHRTGAPSASRSGIAQGNVNWLVGRSIKNCAPSWISLRKRTKSTIKSRRRKWRISLRLKGTRQLRSQWYKKLINLHLLHLKLNRYLKLKRKRIGRTRTRNKTKQPVKPSRYQLRSQKRLSQWRNLLTFPR